jgi:hypothetical protein
MPHEVIGGISQLAPLNETPGSIIEEQSELQTYFVGRGHDLERRGRSCMAAWHGI